MTEPPSPRRRLLHIALGVLVLPAMIVVIALLARVLNMSAQQVSDWADAMIAVPLLAAGGVLLYLQRRKR